MELIDTDPEAVALAATASVEAGLKDTVPEAGDAVLSASTVFSPDGTARPRPRDVGEFSLGDVVGDRYVITEQLGHGGCGFVYAAHDRQLDVAVALKTLRPDVRLSEDAVSELKSEILMARKVTHANVCRIFDFGVHDGAAQTVCFMTMELIRGETLADRIARDKRIPLVELIPIADQVLAALDAAHGAGVVHADLKPANILLTETDEGIRAVVTDFGLATAHTSDIEDSAKGAFGTPAYMAPEQVEGRTLTPATDHYALGCTLYHALSGKLPFVERTAYETALARLEKTPPRLSEVADISGKWVDVVTGLMARHERDRLTSADVRATLDPRPRRRRLQLLAALAIGAVLATIFALLLTRERVPDRLPLSVPDDPLAAELLERAEVMLTMRLRESAVDELRRARKIAGDHPRILARLAVATHTTRIKNPPSLELARRAVEMTPKGDERDYYRALELRLANRHAEATDVLTRLADKYPKDVRIGAVLVMEQTQLGLFDLAAKTLADLEPTTPAEEMQVKFTAMRVEVHGQRYANVIGKARDTYDYAVANNMPLFAALAQAAEAGAYRHLGDHERARELGEAVLRAAEVNDYPPLILEANQALVPIAMSRHEFGRARELVERERDVLELLGKTLARDQTGVTFAELLAATGETERALAEVNTVLPAVHLARAFYWEAYALVVRSMIHAARGETERAAGDCEVGETIFRSIKSQRLAAFALARCAHAYLVAGRLDDSARTLEESTVLRAARNLDFLVAQNDLERAELEIIGGRTTRAAEITRAALEVFHAQGLNNDEAEARVVLARIALRRDDLDDAGEQLALAREARSGNGWQTAIELEIVGGLLDAARDRDRAALERIEAAIERARQGGYRVLELDGRLALAAALDHLGDNERAETIRAAAHDAADETGLVLYRYLPTADDRAAQKRPGDR